MEILFDYALFVKQKKLVYTIVRYKMNRKVLELLNEKLYKKFDNNQTKMASYLEMDQGTLSKIARGLVKNPSRENALKIANYLELDSPDSVYAPSPVLTIKSLTPAHKIPVINKTQCGEWRDYTDLSYPAGIADRYEYAPTHDQHAFFVIASGDSMTGSGISEGDLLLIEPGREVLNGSIVLAKGDNGCTIKKFQQKGDTIFLLPTNEKYDPIILTEKDVKREKVRFYRVTKVVREI